MSLTRPNSPFRQLGKFGLFLAKRHSPGRAWWLARKDAPKRQDYRRVSSAALESAALADPSWADVIAEGGRIRSKTLDLEFVGDDLASRGYSTWTALAQLGWKFAHSRPAGLLASQGSFHLRITTDEERDMIKEIFLARCYDLRLPGSWQVVDIGANVGMAALFFANQPWAKHVFSFEPFAPTADGFRLNLDLNPSLTPKITLRQTALGETDGTLSVDYHPTLRGSMSLVGLGGWRASVTGEEIQKIPITVERASRALAPIIAARGNDQLLAKIDCEGSEYGIVRELHASGALVHFSALVIEWHARGPDELIKILSERGFALHIHPLSPDQKTLGLIYATRLPAVADYR